MENIFSPKDIEFIIEKELDFQKIQQQLHFFKKGVSKINLERAAIKNDGIKVLSEDEKQFLQEIFENNKHEFSIEKFTPASGAASRMFKFLTEFLNDFAPENETINAYINRTKNTDLSIFLIGFKNFPFYKELKEYTILSSPEYKNLSRDKKDFLLIETLLRSNHFNYANKPKGILPFHKIINKTLTPIDEHIKESLFYKVKNKKRKLHFTISKEHEWAFTNHIPTSLQLDITYSFQDPKTDTIAVDENNLPFRDNNNRIVFRPGGHGALIENLNNLNSDIVYIKNIDNVSDVFIEETKRSKKITGGLLIHLQTIIFEFLNLLIENRSLLEDNKIIEITDFIQKELNHSIPYNFENFTKEEKINLLIDKLDRPIRICGMVKNEGEPGGGPFWVKNTDNSLSLQIVETSQIDLENISQKDIINQSTHFNPVDIVCGIKNYKGEKFDLHQYVDHSTGFIVEKTKFGRPVKGYELPGLWNGAMAFWTTIFIEVPLCTFTPVKTVNDLLKSAHQPKSE